jgi:small subunit ribosomal protein S6e
MIYNKSLATEFEGEILGSEFKGYLFKISGGNDKQGFGMKQGVLTHGRVRLLMSPGDSCFRGHGRRQGERLRKSVRGCIVSPDIASLNLTIVKQGDKPITRLTDGEIPLSRGPKRGTKVCKLFHLTGTSDEIISYSKTVSPVTQLNSTRNKKNMKHCKMTLAFTPLKLQRRRTQMARKKKRIQVSNSKAIRYHELLVSRLKNHTIKSQTLAKRRTRF